jgi:hypothetical protein
MEWESEMKGRGGDPLRRPSRGTRRSPVLQRRSPRSRPNSPSSERAASRWWWWWWWWWGVWCGGPWGKSLRRKWVSPSPSTSSPPEQALRMKHGVKHGWSTDEARVKHGKGQLWVKHKHAAPTARQTWVRDEQSTSQMRVKHVPNILRCTMHLSRRVFMHTSEKTTWWRPRAQALMYLDFLITGTVPQDDLRFLIYSTKPT